MPNTTFHTPLTLHGLPRSLVIDGWWMSLPDATPTPPNRHPAFDAVHPHAQTLALLLGLILLADILFYGHPKGLSLAVFAAATHAAAFYQRRARPSRRHLVLILASLLPVIDHVQTLSVLFLLAGLILTYAQNLLSVTKSLAAKYTKTLTQLFSYPLAMMVAGARGTAIAASYLSGKRITAQTLRNWALPVFGALVLATLMLFANPVLNSVLDSALNISFNPAPAIWRILFWLFIALLVAPLLAPNPDTPVQASSHPRWSFGFNATSVANALILFNLMLAVQTALDARYMLLGIDLPNGMTYAEYAQNGAYSLLATALLAGLFALAAQPHLQGRRMVRILLQIWIGQNILLTLTAALRLSLYIEVYGLTYLRIHAAIWMILVVICLALILFQIVKSHPNSWLTARALSLALCILFVSSLTNFAHIIAAYNVTQEKVDKFYLCELGPTAAAALAATNKEHAAHEDWRYDTYNCTFTSPQTEGWRDWGFRNWRVTRSLAAQQATTAQEAQP